MRERIFEGGPRYDVFNKRLAYCPTSLPKTLSVISFVETIIHYLFLPPIEKGLNLNLQFAQIYIGRKETHTHTHRRSISKRACIGVINVTKLGMQER